MKTYCTQNNGDCQTCSLVNCDTDCKNNPIIETPEQREEEPSAIDKFTWGAGSIRID
jgi:hypothetical protein